MTPEPVDRHRRRAHPRPLPRFDHHRPHLAGRLDQARRPGRQVPARAPGAPGRLQLVRRAPRQPRSDDARHLRQHPHQEPDGRRRRRRRHRPLARPASSMPIYDAAMRYQAEGVPLVIFAGKEYGTGSSRDWAAKGTRLLGVRAVIAESFERIHRSNLVGMGVLPLIFDEGTSWQSLGLTRRRDGHHPRPRRRPEAAPDARGRDHLRRRQRQARCRSSAASTRSTSSNISATAASCTTCCASWPPDDAADVTAVSPERDSHLSAGRS